MTIGKWKLKKFFSLQREHVRAFSSIKGMKFGNLILIGT